MAAAISRDLPYAEQLYREVQRKVASMDTDFPIIEKIRGRIPRRLNELNEARAIIEYEQWVMSKDTDALIEMRRALAQINADEYRRATVFNLNAIAAFVLDGSTPEAVAWLNRIGSDSRNATWHLNVAFLHAYDGYLRVAIQHYRKALNLAMDADLIAKIEDFVTYFAEKAPERYQLYYCLGFFNWKVKGDLERAEKDFRAFLGQRRGDAYENEVGLAKKWLLEIGQERQRKQRRKK
jgi:tetratricopeptide (TPR) repeat protein